MTARSTPFGLFAGSSVGRLGARTPLTLPPRSAYRRHTRLDMDYLSSLVAALESDPMVRQTLRYRPNTSLYPPGVDSITPESRVDTARGRTYHLVAVDESPELEATLARAREHDGAYVSELADGLVKDLDVPPGEAAEFVDELVTSQLLVSDLGPDVTGDEAIEGLIQRVDHRSLRPLLERVRGDLARVDHAGVGGNSVEDYAAIRTILEPLPAKADPARLFQVDMVKPTSELRWDRWCSPSSPVGWDSCSVWLHPRRSHRTSRGSSSGLLPATSRPKCRWWKCSTKKSALVSPRRTIPEVSRCW